MANNHKEYYVGEQGVRKIVLVGEEPQVTREVVVEYISEDMSGCRVIRTDTTSVYEGQSAMVTVENGFLNVVVVNPENVLIADDYYPVESVLRVLNDAVDPA